jgi:hypothetical protein
MMNQTPHILFLDDVPADAGLAARELRKAGLEFTSLRVKNEADFRRALDGATPVGFMTGYSVETVQNKFVKHRRFVKEAGALLLQKPYNVESLGLKVRAALDGRKVSRRN